MDGVWMDSWSYKRTWTFFLVPQIKKYILIIKQTQANCVELHCVTGAHCVLDTAVPSET